MANKRWRVVLYIEGPSETDGSWPSETLFRYPFWHVVRGAVMRFTTRLMTDAVTVTVQSVERVPLVPATGEGPPPAPVE